MILDQNTEGILCDFVTFNNGVMGFMTCANVLFDWSNGNPSQTPFDVVQASYSYRNTNEACCPSKIGFSGSSKSGCNTRYRVYRNIPGVYCVASRVSAPKRGKPDRGMYVRFHNLTY
jgi:hypothetical protein